MNGVSREEFDDVLNQLATIDADLNTHNRKLKKRKLGHPSRVK